ncbi:MAG: histidinol-phosphatase [Pseudomonadota bacterium]
MLSDRDLEDLNTVAMRLADAAGVEALRWFRQTGLETENKDSEGFDPVTRADRAAEAAMRAILGQSRAEDGIFGEEEGRSEGQSGLTWVLDPIDGTRAYISGLPTWGILIALDDGDRGRIGVIDQPFTGERFSGLGTETPRAKFSRAGKDCPISTRSCPNLAQATLMTTDTNLFDEDELSAFEEVRKNARLTRYGMDCYAYAMVAIGQVDLVIETGLNAYDIAAPTALIQAAGGIVTDWRGGDCRWGGQTVAAGDPRIHEEALEILNRST